MCGRKKNVRVFCRLLMRSGGLESLSYLTLPYLTLPYLTSIYLNLPSSPPWYLADPKALLRTIPFLNAILRSSIQSCR